ncbi:TraR/DksA C4-type zinc finger protein [Candidatus Kaiserbacteria bacterium]|nr:TraR/DksA C4-type zinc finger protein [Candidatus Kaiserbacteria bacterium]
MIDTASYKEKLTESLARVTEELKTLGIHNPENPADWVPTPPTDVDGPEADPVDAADRVEEWDEHAATLAPLEHEYNDIIRALKKIENDTYGICEISGEEIEQDRLEANPAARTCKAHMEEEEDLPQ